MRDTGLRIFYTLTVVVLCATHFGFGSAVGGSSTPPSLPSKNKTCDECGGEIGDILQQIRAQMNDANEVNGKSIQAYVVPMNDAHQNEYIADHDKRLQYITKFTGSAGEAIVTIEGAAVWTDSRYHLQAEQQLDLNCWTLMKKGLSNVPSASHWLISNLPANSTVGVDPFLMTAKDFRQMEKELKASGHELISISNNLIDATWISRPPPSNAPIIPLDIKFSGKEAGLKISEVMDKIKKEGAESIIITTLDDIAWLLNLRGSDIEYNPLFFSYVLLSSGKSYFLVDKKKIENEAKNQMNVEKANLIVRDYDEILDALNEIVNTTSGKIVMSTSVSQAVSKIIPLERRIEKDIVAEMKSVKNPIEAKNMEKAHIRDGFALIQYLHWLNITIDKENVTELSGADKLSQFRAKQENFRGLSFRVISAAGEHAAMAHYSPTIETNKRITRDEIYLVDSGGHYWDGTTDVTRTVHFGIPSMEEKICYTRVLKGFIALATSIFPKNTPLSYLDNVARRALWQAGLDYGHGTGHGVGMYLSVHEYPPLINSKGTKTLQENIFTSNEPGYYKDNEFGIRIEDVIKVVASDIKNAFAGQGGLTFQSITYAPLQTKLIATDMLTKEEAYYVNAYNQKVLDTIGPLLLKDKETQDTYRWLVQETRQICSWAK